MGLRAGVVELVDAPDSKSGSERSVGSTPTARTTLYGLRPWLGADMASEPLIGESPGPGVTPIRLRR